MKQVKFIEKCLSILLVTIILIISLENEKAYAVKSDSSKELTKVSSTFVDPTENPEAYKPTIQGEENSLKEKTANLLGTINAFGIVVSIISLILIGIKYMLGSVEEKAEYKKTMIPYIIGAVLLGSCTTIANLLYSISTDIFG